jgi:hypothetical protein
MKNHTNPPTAHEIRNEQVASSNLASGFGFIRVFWGG